MTLEHGSTPSLSLKLFINWGMSYNMRLKAKNSKIKLYKKKRLLFVIKTPEELTVCPLTLKTLFSHISNKNPSQSAQAGVRGTLGARLAHDGHGPRGSRACTPGTAGRLNTSEEFTDFRQRESVSPFLK